MLSAERALDVLDGRPAGSLEERSRWGAGAGSARRAVGPQLHARDPERFDELPPACPHTVRHAVVAIAQAYVPDRDGILRDLLAGAIGDCAQLIHRNAPSAATSDTAAWEAACQPTGTAVGKASAR